MRKILTLSAALAMAALVWAGGPDTPAVQTKAPAKKPSTTAAKKPATTTAATKTAHTTVRKPVVAPRTTWRNRQSSPTPDRYKEIQVALVARGYLSEEDATGAWGPPSAEGLKKFQAEQTLETTGKIDSLSLIALGLGPRHDSTTPRVVDGNVPQPESGRN